MTAEARAELQSDLPDLAGARLADLRDELGETATAALRRILAALDAGVEPVAGFQSAI
jgi:FXSXX-COOH protein